MVSVSWDKTQKRIVVEVQVAGGTSRVVAHGNVRPQGGVGFDLLDFPGETASFPSVESACRYFESQY